MAERTVEEKFVPLPGEWPNAPIAALAQMGSCDDCCTAATGGDLCGPCDTKYKEIAEGIRPYIRLEIEARERAEQALREIAEEPWKANFIVAAYFAAPEKAGE